MTGVERHHRMPFGAELEEGEGAVRFRLWAPGARRVELLLESGESTAELDMEREQDGWYRVVTDRAGPGSRYRYRIDGDLRVPDPASRHQPGDVHGASEVVDPRAWRWRDEHWQGRPWHEAVIYELHVGTFTPEGTFEAARGRLEYLRDLGVTAVELMPIADFPGDRNWGYDGVLPFAPAGCYGPPAALKSLVDEAHARGLMVFLDVVYNHFGPEGNYLHAYARQFFTRRHHTPWGAAINFDGRRSRAVREYFVHNALYWLEEYHVDGLRLDAVHAIADDSRPDILTELAERVRHGPGARRHVHLVLENDDNAARYLTRDAEGNPRLYTAQWNDDLHHALHALVAGETHGYYEDYADAPVRHLARCLTEGFAYQGELSPYRGGRPRGEPTTGLPATAFVGFLQNHDQVGNRAFGERIAMLADPRAVRAAHALLLLAPSPPLLFMGEEFAAAQPFLFFCDFGPELAAAVTEGRRREFARFPDFADGSSRDRIPDPNDPRTRARSVLDWDGLGASPHAETLSHVRELLRIRSDAVAPRLGGMGRAGSEYEIIAERALRACWRLGDGAELGVLANLGEVAVTGVATPPGQLLYPARRPPGLDGGELPGWSVLWFLHE